MYGHSLIVLLALSSFGTESAFGQTRGKVVTIEEKATSSAALFTMEASTKTKLADQKLWANERYPFPATKLDYGLRMAWQTAIEQGKNAALTRLATEKATLAANGEDVVVIVSPSAGTSIEQLETAVRAVGTTIIRSGPETIKAALPID